MFDLMMPTNATFFFRFVVAIATFDVIPVDGLMDWIGTYIRASQVANETPKSFVDFDFSDSDPI